MTSSSSEVQSSEIGAPIPRKRRRTYKNQEDNRICNSDKTEQIHQALAKRPYLFVQMQDLNSL